MNKNFEANFTTMPFHQQLRFLRKRNRQTQQVIGELIGLSERSIRAYETAERLPDLATLSMLIEVLDANNVTTSNILTAWKHAVETQGICYRTQCKHS